MMLGSSIHIDMEGSEQKYHERDSNHWYPDEMDWRKFGFVTRVNNCALN